MPRGVYKRRKFTEKTDVAPVVNDQALEKKYVPKPDMGDIKPPPKQKSTCACYHEHSKHYGGPKDWCNVGGCLCQEFK